MTSNVVMRIASFIDDFVCVRCIATSSHSHVSPLVIEHAYEGLKRWNIVHSSGG